MALFDQLLRLHVGARPEEDFFTEVVAGLAQHDAELLGLWLETAGVRGAAGKSAEVVTQRRYEALASCGHEQDSIVDMVVRLHDPTGEAPSDLVFVESKLGSGEGASQLQRYAEHLAREPISGCRWLVYVTREYDPKAAQPVEGVHFLQTRWHQFYRVLKGRSRQPLRDETLRFMETHRMAQGNRFTPLDVLVIRNVQRVVGLMQAALDGDVFARMKTISGSTRSNSSLAKILEEQGGWVLESFWAKTECGLQAGFVQPESEAVDAYPLVAVTFFVGPKAPDRELLRSAVRIKCEKDSAWEPRNFGGGTKWFGMRRSRSLEQFAGEADQVKAAKNVLLAALDDVERWMNEYADLRIREN